MEVSDIYISLIWNSQPCGNTPTNMNFVFYSLQSLSFTPVICSAEENDIFIAHTALKQL